MGMDAYTFNHDTNVQFAFQSAIADQMPGIYPDEITWALTTSLTTDATTTVAGRRVLQTAASGFGILYNVTTNINRFGYTDPQACYNDLNGQLVAGIANGNFSSSIQNHATILGVTALQSASSSASDYTALQWVYVGANPATKNPTSTPSQAPSSHPTVTSTPIPFRPRYFELVAGIVVAGCVVTVYYLSSVFTGMARTQQVFEQKMYEEQKPAVEYLDVAKLTEQDLKIQRDNTAVA